MIVKLKIFIRDIIYRYIKPPVTSSQGSYSQVGEDRILLFLFETLGIDKISYIDLGANDPISCNNTYYFYERGSSGVLVEPDPKCYINLKDARPNDIVLNSGINDVEVEDIDFYLFENSQLNTLDKPEAEKRVESGINKLLGVQKISLLTIEGIIKKYLENKCPMLISIDVEGLDYDILKSFNFKDYPVPVWIVETCEYSENHIKPKIKPLIDLMLNRGYMIYADTYVNTIFVNKNWFYNYQHEI